MRPEQSTVRITRSILSEIVVLVVVLPSSFSMSATSLTKECFLDVPRTT
ncbi:hypothetical protein FRUB_10088 [Fimbriiglobus ruber]|uniref:Uncharacterized protein n=1 Tax=Fimbriiglobus ruber TaxID=1908690 RepID=A0A225DDD4_9BACT|nr:hypothetical protein FRUB_10088 [Fimbriiglobus ruber]